MTMPDEARTNGYVSPATRAWDARFVMIERRLVELAESGERRIEILRDALADFCAAELAQRDGEIADLKQQVAELRHEFREACEEFSRRLGRAPLAKTWEMGVVFYLGDVVIHDGATFQAQRDTCQPTDHTDWVCLAARGVDGADGCTPKLCGKFFADKVYKRFDVIELDGNSFIATRNDPGIPGIDDGWQVLCSRGFRGPVGDVGPRGRKGERGARGADAVTVVAWTLDKKRYVAIPTMSDGRAGAPLDLRGLFEQFIDEAVGPIVDAAIEDAEKKSRLLPFGGS